MENRDQEHMMFEYLNNSLDLEEKEKFEAWLSQHPEQQKLLEEMKQLLHISLDWSEEEPPSTIRLEMEAMISKEKQKQSRDPIARFELFLQKLSAYQGIKRIAFYLMLILISGFIGFNLNNGKESQNELPELSQRIEEMQLTIAKLQLKSFSSSDRIKGVSNIATSSLNTSEILEDLTYRLKYDESVHVRMSIAETLSNYIDDPSVKMAMYEAAQKEQELIARVEFIKIFLGVDKDLAQEIAADILQSETIQPKTQQLISDLLNSKTL